MNFDVDPHEYEVVDGEGRVSDAKAAGILEVPAIIYPADTPPVVLDFLRTVRNNARRNNPVAEARSYQALVNHGMPPDEIAKTQGVKVATIRKRLRLASLDNEFLEAVVEKKIAVGTAERIANLSTSAKDDVRRVLRESGRVRGKDVSRVLDAERADALQGMPGIFPDAPEKGEAPPVENVERGDPTFALREAIRRHLERGESKRSIERLTDEVYSEVHG